MKQQNLPTDCTVVLSLTDNPVFENDSACKTLSSKKIDISGSTESKKSLETG